jgi:hypothetical protein
VKKTNENVTKSGQLDRIGEHVMSFLEHLSMITIVPHVSLGMLWPLKTITVLHITGMSCKPVIRGFIIHEPLTTSAGYPLSS